MRSRILLLCALCALCSCSDKDFLNAPIDNRTHINSLEEIEAALVKLLPRSDHLFTEMMTDNYTFRDIAGHVVGAARDGILPIYTFQITKQSFPSSTFLESGFNPNVAWRRYYFTINNCYLLLSRISAYSPKGEEEKERISSMKGQCLAIKAYCHFMLVNLFAKHYNASTAAQDKGIPYIDEYSAEAVKISPIKTVEEIYNLVEKDLVEALSLTKDANLPLPKLAFNTTAIKAFLSRLYLYKKEWDKCIAYATQAIEVNSKILDIDTLYREYYLAKNSIEDYSKNYFDPANGSYLMVAEDTYQLIAYFWSGFYPSPVQQVLREKGLSAYLFIPTSFLYEDIIPYKYLYFITQKYRDMPIPLFTVDEVYYNRAEALAEEGRLDEAKQDLEKLLAKDLYRVSGSYNRIIAAINRMSNKDSLRDEILLRRRLRFHCEGLRWFDIKRHQLLIAHGGSSSVPDSIDGKNPEEYAIRYPLEEVDFLKTE